MWLIFAIPFFPTKITDKNHETPLKIKKSECLPAAARRAKAGRNPKELRMKNEETRIKLRIKNVETRKN